MADATLPLPGLEPGVRSGRRRHVRNERDVERERERERQGKHWRTPKVCPGCDKTYAPTSGHQKVCSQRCGGIVRRRTWPSSPIHIADCPACGALFVSRRGRKACSEACAYEIQKAQIKARILDRYRTDPAFRDQVLAAAHARRADKLGLGSSQVLLSYLIERDKGRCQIPDCQFRSRRVAKLGTKGPRKPSIDHVIPLSRGGTHELTNVQLAHYRCNLRKHNSGGGEQLFLLG